MEGFNNSGVRVTTTLSLHSPEVGLTKEGTCLLPVFFLVSGDPVMTVAECSDALATMKGHFSFDELCFTGLLVGAAPRFAVRI